MSSIADFINVDAVYESNTCKFIQICAVACNLLEMHLCCCSMLVCGSFDVSPHSHINILTSAQVTHPTISTL